MGAGMRQFNVGDRVAALPGTDWDDDLDKKQWTESERAYLKLHGHYGHVVAHCNQSDCDLTPHVRWEGTYDGRMEGPTDWTGGHIWHMSPDEIEHID